MYEVYTYMQIKRFLSMISWRKKKTISYSMVINDWVFEKEKVNVRELAQEAIEELSFRINPEQVDIQNNLENIEITVGENLSYENEVISKYEVEELVYEERIFDINVVVIREVRTCTI